MLSERKNRTIKNHNLVLLASLMLFLVINSFFIGIYIQYFTEFSNSLLSPENDALFHKTLIVGSFSVAFILVVSFVYFFMKRQYEIFKEKNLHRELKLKIITEHTVDWEYWVAPDGSIEYMSPSVYDFTGYKAEMFIEDKELLNVVLLSGEKKPLNNALSNVATRDYEERFDTFMIKHKNGKVIWISHRSIPVFDGEGKYLGRRASIQNVTKLINNEKRLIASEKKFKHIFDNGTNAYFISDKKGVLKEVNDIAVEMTSYSKEELIGMNLSNLLDTYQVDEVEKEVNKIFGIREEFNYTGIKCKHGNVCYIDITEKSIVLDGQHAKLFVVVDISRKIRIYKQMMKKVFDSVDAERKRISKELHDGLGSLLTTVNLYLNLIQSEGVDRRVDEYVDLSIENIVRAIKSTKEIVNELRPKNLVEDGLVTSIEKLCDRLNLTGRISVFFESNIENPINPIVEDHLFRIINELLNNTLNHANAKKVFIGINKKNNQIHLKYNDDGIGFCYRKDFDMKSKNGLFNIKERIAELDGDFTIESEQGKGIKVDVFV